MYNDGMKCYQLALKYGSKFVLQCKIAENWALVRGNSVADCCNADRLRGEAKKLIFSCCCVFYSPNDRVFLLFPAHHLSLGRLPSRQAFNGNRGPKQDSGRR